MKAKLRAIGINELNGALDKFLADFPDEATRRKFLNDELDVEVWKKFSNNEDWVRKNVDLLDKLTKKNDLAFTQKVRDYYAVAMKRSTPSGFNGEGVYDGIRFNKYGHPELYSHISSPNHIVEIDMKGNYTTDMTNAKDELLKKLSIGETLEKVNQKGGWSPFYIIRNGTKEGPYTWHHHQNGKSMYPVIKEIHDKIVGKHSGGREIVLSYPELKDFFDEL